MSDLVGNLDPFSRGAARFSQCVGMFLYLSSQKQSSCIQDLFHVSRCPCQGNIFFKVWEFEISQGLLHFLPKIGEISGNVEKQRFMNCKRYQTMAKAFFHVWIL